MSRAKGHGPETPKFTMTVYGEGGFSTVCARLQEDDLDFFSNRRRAGGTK